MTTMKQQEQTHKKTTLKPQRQPNKTRTTTKQTDYNNKTTKKTQQQQNEQQQEQQPHNKNTRIITLVSAVSPLLACDHQGGLTGYQNSSSLIFLVLVYLFCCKSGLISHQTFASVWMVLRLGYTRCLTQNHRDTLIGK